MRPMDGRAGAAPARRGGQGDAGRHLREVSSAHLRGAWRVLAAARCRPAHIHGTKLRGVVDREHTHTGVKKMQPCHRLRTQRSPGASSSPSVHLGGAGCRQHTHTLLSRDLALSSESVPDWSLPRLACSPASTAALTACARSDLHPFHEREKGIAKGCVTGHEFVGHVARLGGEVQGLRLGDRVVAPFTANCGDCFFCSQGATCRCSHPQVRLCAAWGHAARGWGVCFGSGAEGITRGTRNGTEPCALAQPGMLCQPAGGSDPPRGQSRRRIPARAARLCGPWQFLQLGSTAEASHHMHKSPARYGMACACVACACVACACVACAGPAVWLGD